MLGVRPPHEVEGAAGHAAFDFTVVHLAEDEGLEAQVRLQSGVTGRVVQRVGEPANARHSAKLLPQESMTLHHTCKQILEGCTRLVSRGPTTVDELESARLHKTFHLVLDLFRLSGVPHCEQLYVGEAKLEVWLQSQLLQDAVERGLDAASQAGQGRSAELLVHRMCAKYAIVCVGHHVNSYFLSTLNVRFLITRLRLLLYSESDHLVAAQRNARQHKQTHQKRDWPQREYS